MTTYYYYAPERLGPVDAGTIKLLALSGVIVPKTVIETSDGKRFLAEKIQNLTFKTQVPQCQQVTPPEVIVNAETEQTVETGQTDETGKTNETRVDLVVICIMAGLALLVGIVACVLANSATGPVNPYLAGYIIGGFLSFAISASFIGFIVWAVCKHLANQKQLIEQNKNDQTPHGK